MLETGTIAAIKPHRARRTVGSMPRASRAKVSNDPLARFKGNTAEGRRARDLFRLGRAEIGGRLSIREQLLISNWVLLQMRLEAGDLTLATETRHAWRAVLRAKRQPRPKQPVPVQWTVGNGA
jgi:hypothetical protein